MQDVCGKIRGEFENENIVCNSMNSNFAFPQINYGRQSKNPSYNSCWSALILDIIQCKTDHTAFGLS